MLRTQTRRAGQLPTDRAKKIPRGFSNVQRFRAPAGSNDLPLSLSMRLHRLIGPADFAVRGATFLEAEATDHETSTFPT